MSKGFKEPKQFKMTPGNTICMSSTHTVARYGSDGKVGCFKPAPEPMPIPKHIHYAPSSSSSTPITLTHVSSYSPFAPKTPVSYASMPGAPKIPHFHAGPSSSSSSSTEHHVLVAPRETPPTGASSSSSTPVTPLSASEIYAIEQARIQQAREAAGIANKLQMAKEFDATPVGIATSRLKEAEESYAEKVEQYKNVPRNFNYAKNRAIAAQQVEKSAKQVEYFQENKYKVEQEASQKLWHEREHTRIWAENIKMYEALANKQAKEKEEVRWPNLSRLKIRNYEIQFAA